MIDVEVYTLMTILASYNSLANSTFRSIFIKYMSHLHKIYRVIFFFFFVDFNLLVFNIFNSFSFLAKIPKISKSAKTPKVVYVCEENNPSRNTYLRVLEYVKPPLVFQ